MKATAYTDGACSGNPGPGGWGWIVPGGRWACGSEPSTTNQRMELTAAAQAINTLLGDRHDQHWSKIEVVSDSHYVVNCFVDRWWEGWITRNWRNSNKKPVANRDLWEPLIETYRRAPIPISFRWVKGHSGDKWNDLADSLATQATTLQICEGGLGLPEWIGSFDS